MAIFQVFSALFGDFFFFSFFFFVLEVFMVLWVDLVASIPQ